MSIRARHSVITSAMKPKEHGSNMRTSEGAINTKSLNIDFHVHPYSGMSLLSIGLTVAHLIWARLRAFLGAL